MRSFPRPLVTMLGRMWLNPRAEFSARRSGHAGFLAFPVARVAAEVAGRIVLLIVPRSVNSAYKVRCTMASIQFVERFVFADNILEFLVLDSKFIDPLIVDSGILILLFSWLFTLFSFYIRGRLQNLLVKVLPFFFRTIIFLQLPIRLEFEVSLDAVPCCGSPSFGIGEVHAELHIVIRHAFVALHEVEGVAHAMR
jgi:hypothetical protein